MRMTSAQAKKLLAQTSSTSKYRNVKTVVDGITFDSKAEATYYKMLALQQQEGDILYFLRQVPFHLPGGVVYRCDFMVSNLVGDVEFVDVKGVMTKEFKIKKKLVEALYPVRIKCVQRRGERFVEID